MRKDKKIDLILVIPIGSLFIIAGFWMMFKGGQVCIQAYRTKSWKLSTGKIIESKIETSCDSDGDTLYEAKIDYAYSLLFGDFGSSSCGIYSACRLFTNPSALADTFPLRMNTIDWIGTYSVSKLEL